MRFTTQRVWYRYPAAAEDRCYFKDYTVPENEPFPADHAWKQWQRDQTVPGSLVAFVSTEEVLQEPTAKVVQLPIGFCETAFPGYFWNAHELKLYSLKNGVLKEMQRMRWPLRHGLFDGYQISHLGKRRYLSFVDLARLVPSRTVIPTAPTPKKPGSRWSRT